MSDVNQPVHTSQGSSIAQWAYKTIRLQGVRLRTRLRGNDLHILCESSQCPEAATVVSRFVQALKATDGTQSVFPTDLGRPIYQIILYGRALDRQRPDWIEAIHLSQQGRGGEEAGEVGEVGEETITAVSTPPNVSVSQREEVAVPMVSVGSLVSNESLARTGHPDAIARYLSETLSSLGVSVKVRIQDASSPTTQHSLQRLWVVCDSDYSPDSSLLAQTVTQRLRDLKLKGFHDARILAQVSGEATPDWVLRVDMTPAEEMLKDWAAWGDVQAIARLLNQTLASQKLQVRAVLKEATLHLFCSYTKGNSAPSKVPEKQIAASAIAPFLSSLKPQGIHAATVYGMRGGEGERGSNSQSPSEVPVWVEWLNLPASSQPALAETALALAQKGDEPALVFLLQRLLNSDLDWRLATGGVCVSLRRKQDLLHIMTEASVCPLQGQVASPIAKFIRQLHIPKVAGVRVYGRRAGQSSHEWIGGVDFVSRSSPALKAPPVMFASSTAAFEKNQDQIVSIANPDQPTESPEIDSAFSQAVGLLSTAVQQALCATQLFIPVSQQSVLSTQTAGMSRSKGNGEKGSPLGSFFVRSNKSDTLSIRVALVWGCLGLLLTLQADWLIGLMLRRTTQITDSSVVMEDGLLSESSVEQPIPEISLQKRKDKAPVFNSSGFTKEGESKVIVNNGRGSAGGAAILAAARSPFPAFNNRMLDEKLALYQQRLIQRGGVPPEVLIVGSSRAMRGVDPTALQTALTNRGLTNVEVFNFGVNGATAQVVDLILRRILISEQHPKLIIWADGARAFNSGRVDVTYNAIATSPGYQQVNTGTLPKLGTRNLKVSTSQSSNLTNSSQTFETRFSNLLGNFSATYPQRDRLQRFVKDWVTQLIPDASSPIKAKELNPQAETEEANLSSLNSDIDFDGFLPLSMRFAPASYYKQHSKVSGDYDSDYESFQMGGQQDIALDALLQFLQGHQIQLVFVNLPLTKEYLDPVRTKYEQEFQQHMQQLAAKKGFVFRDLSGLWQTKNEFFSDPSHLNRYGAAEVSNQLIQDSTIPWPTR